MLIKPQEALENSLLPSHSCLLTLLPSLLTKPCLHLHTRPYQNTQELAPSYTFTNTLVPLHSPP